MRQLMINDGDGYRVALLVTEGVKYARLLHVPTLQRIELDIGELERQLKEGVARDVPITPGLVKRIRATRRTLDKYSKRYPAAFVRDALVTLREERAAAKEPAQEELEEAIAELDAAPPPGEEGQPPAGGEAPAAPKEKKAPPVRQPSTTRFQAPVRDQVKAPGRGKRLLVFQMLQRPEGATLEQIMAATGWDEGNAVAGTRLLHTDCGYGLSQDKDGAIRVVLPA